MKRDYDPTNYFIFDNRLQVLVHSVSQLLHKIFLKIYYVNVIIITWLIQYNTLTLTLAALTIV